MLGGAFKHGERTCVVALGLESQAEVVGGVGIVGLRLQCPAEGGDGFHPAPPAVEDDPEMVLSGREARLPLDRLQEIAFGLLGLPQPSEQRAAMHQHRDGVGAVGECLGQLRERFLRLSGFEKELREEGSGRRVPRCVVDIAPEQQDGVEPPAGGGELPGEPRHPRRLQLELAARRPQHEPRHQGAERPEPGDLVAHRADRIPFKVEAIETFGPGVVGVGGTGGAETGHDGT